MLASWNQGQPVRELEGFQPDLAVAKGASFYGRNRVTGNFTGTTDEIIQWVACKWGVDEDAVRAQIIKESYWYQSNVGDNGESFGLGQVRGDHVRQGYRRRVRASGHKARDVRHVHEKHRPDLRGDRREPLAPRDLTETAEQFGTAVEAPVAFIL